MPTMSARWHCRSAVRTGLLDAGYGRAIQHWAELLESSCDQRDASRLQQLVEVAYGYEPLATLRTADFLRYVESGACRGSYDG